MRLFFSALLLAIAGPLAAQEAVSPPEAPPAAAPIAAPAPIAPLVWTDTAARETLAEVQASAKEGLNPANYAPAALEAALQSGDEAAIAAAAEASWMALAKDYAAGHTPVASRLGWKSPPPRSDPEFLRAKLAEALAAGDVGATLRGLLPTDYRYRALRTALPNTTDKAMRARIRANMDRWRWMPRRASGAGTSSATTISPTAGLRATGARPRAIWPGRWWTASWAPRSHSSSPTPGLRSPHGTSTTTRLRPPRDVLTPLASP